METAYQSLLQHLEAREVRYRADADTQVVSAVLGTPDGLFPVHARITEDHEMLQVFGHLPINVPAGSRPSIAEAITRANYGLRLGHFEMDYGDGELRFYVSHLLGEGELPDATIERLIGTTVAVLNHYLPAFMSVIYANELPEDTIRRDEAAT